MLCLPEISALDPARLALLVASLLVVCGFELVNGFHDTANAVATVIYTRALRPWAAVTWSALWNFLGVWLGGIAVAVSILELLPAELLVQSNPGVCFAMIAAILLAAICWNIATWYVGLPVSSSHTLIGALVGVGIAQSMLVGHFGHGVSWDKVEDVGLALVLSPLLGLGAAALLILLAKRLLPSPSLHAPPVGEAPPPWWIRALLIVTCTGVSYAHGSNDGQKGVGLVMLILIGIVPGSFALDERADAARIARTVAVADDIAWTVRAGSAEHVRCASAGTSVCGVGDEEARILEHLGAVHAALAGKPSIGELSGEARWDVRRRIVIVDAELNALEKRGQLGLPPGGAARLSREVEDLRALVDYAPPWVPVMIALALGVGTMIGWKRIVVTVGERIGKSHMTYAQGAAAEVVTMSTIAVASGAGLPVSTTHVLSSGVAGTMLAQRSGVQRATARNIALAWLLTLPATMLLAAGLFLLFNLFVTHAPG
ncbi:MAG: inorganic phosphate transporter [Minicystis sp.]